MRTSSEPGAILVKSGWSPERQIDIARIQHKLAARGYPVHAAAQDVLHEYGDLVIGPEHQVGAACSCTLHVVTLGATRKQEWPTQYSLLRRFAYSLLGRFTGSPPDDVYFLRIYLSLEACLVGKKQYGFRAKANHSTEWTTLGWLYSIEDGRAILVAQDWTVVFVAATFVELLRYLVAPDQVEIVEIDLDRDENANLMLNELKLSRFPE